MQLLCKLSRNSVYHQYSYYNILTLLLSLMYFSGGTENLLTKPLKNNICSFLSGGAYSSKGEGGYSSILCPFNMVFIVFYMDIICLMDVKSEIPFY